MFRVPLVLKITPSERPSRLPIAFPGAPGESEGRETLMPVACFVALRRNRGQELFASRIRLTSSAGTPVAPARKIKRSPAGLMVAPIRERLSNNLSTVLIG